MALECSKRPKGTRDSCNKNAWGPDISSESSAVKKAVDDTLGHEHQLQHLGAEAAMATIIFMLLQESVFCVKQ